MTTNDEKARINNQLTASLVKASGRADVSVARLVPDPAHEGRVCVDVNVPPQKSAGFRIVQVHVETGIAGLGGQMKAISAYRADVVAAVASNWPSDLADRLK